MNPGGRPRIGGEGEIRESVRVSSSGPGDPGFSLSMQSEQKAFLERIGAGNRSRGFRRLMGVVESIIDASGALKSAKQIVLRENGPGVTADTLNSLAEQIERLVYDGQDGNGQNTGEPG